MCMSQHPLAQSLHEAGALDPYFNMPVGDPSQSGWGKATDLFAGDHTDARDAETFFQDSSSPVYGQTSMEFIEHEGTVGFFGRGAGCCLIWRTRDSDGYCSNCILRPREDQTQRFREMLETASHRLE